MVCCVAFQPYNALAQPIKQALAAGYRFDSKVLDVSNVDVSGFHLPFQVAIIDDLFCPIL